MGVRSGDKFTCFDGVVLQSDTNAADNVEARMRDDEITRFMKHTDVKQILLRRTQKFKEQLNKDSEVTQEPLCNIPEAQTGKDKPKTLEPKRKRTSKVTSVSECSG